MSARFTRIGFSDRNRSESQYSVGLEKTPANFVALTPLSFLTRTAAIYPDHVSTVYEDRVFRSEPEREPVQRRIGKDPGQLRGAYSVKLPDAYRRHLSRSCQHGLRGSGFQIGTGARASTASDWKRPRPTSWRLLR